LNYNRPWGVRRKPQPHRGGQLVAVTCTETHREVVMDPRSSCPMRCRLRRGGDIVRPPSSGI
jgi:hypothetical protein